MKSKDYDINKMTRKEFEIFPHRNWDEKIVCDCLIILPAKIFWLNIIKYNLQTWLSNRSKYISKPEIYDVEGLHYSGYRCMDFVAVKNGEPIYLLSGCSDVIHIDGIGGYGANWLEKYGTVPKAIPPSGWNIDCLSKSGLLRMWPKSGKILCESALSSFEIYALEKENKK